MEKHHFTYFKFSKYGSESVINIGGTKEKILILLLTLKNWVLTIIQKHKKIIIEKKNIVNTLLF